MIIAYISYIHRFFMNTKSLICLYLFMYLFIYLFIYVSIYVFLFIYLLIYLLIYLSIYYLPTCFVDLLNHDNIIFFEIYYHSCSTIFGCVCFLACFCLKLEAARCPECYHSRHGPFDHNKKWVILGNIWDLPINLSDFI